MSWFWSVATMRSHWKSGLHCPVTEAAKSRKIGHASHGVRGRANRGAAKAVGRRHAGRVSSFGVPVRGTRLSAGWVFNLSSRALMVGAHCLHGVARSSAVSSMMPGSCPAMVSPIMANGVLSCTVGLSRDGACRWRLWMTCNLGVPVSSVTQTTRQGLSLIGKARRSPRAPCHAPARTFCMYGAMRAAC